MLFQSTLLTLLACSNKHPNPMPLWWLTKLEQSQLNGTLVEETIAAPDFIALNQDGSERTRDDLMGKPTVIWFYPAANTPG